VSRTGFAEASSAGFADCLREVGFALWWLRAAEARRVSVVCSYWVECVVECVADEVDAHEDEDEGQAGEEPGPPAKSDSGRVAAEAELELDDVGDEVAE
jgi:hypothetical protein